MACNKRNFLLNICGFQMLLTIWRQLFDYLGFMWGPIFFNFFNMVFVIFGFFGAWQYKAKYLLCFCLWGIVWLGWNIFLICFYSNAGILNRESDLLSFGTGGVSWWGINGPGCQSALFLPNSSSMEQGVPKLIAANCYVSFHVIELTQASLHIFIGVLGFYLSCLMISALQNGEQNSSSKKLKMTGLYSTEYISHHSQDSGPEDAVAGSSLRPMTPRRVKRRSGRSSSLPRGTRHRESGSRRSTRSNRSVQRPRSLPPALLDQHTLPHPRHYRDLHGLSNGNLAMGGVINPQYQGSADPLERPPSARSTYSNYHGARQQTFRQNFLAAGPPGYTSETGV